MSVVDCTASTITITGAQPTSAYNMRLRHNGGKEITTPALALPLSLAYMIGGMSTGTFAPLSLISELFVASAALLRRLVVI